MSMAGKFVLEKNDNYDEFMASVGTPYGSIVATNQFRPVIDITHDGDEVVMKSYIGNGYKDHVLSFTIGKECDWTAFGGLLSPFKVKLEKCGKHTYAGTFNFNGFKGMTSFEVQNDRLIQTLMHEGITGRKEYKRLN